MYDSSSEKDTIPLVKRLQVVSMQNQFYEIKYTVIENVASTWVMLNMLNKSSGFPIILSQYGVLKRINHH